MNAAKKGVDYRVSFYTLGCKVNRYETQALREMFEKAGFRAVDEGEQADVFVINTCSVTGIADRKSRQYIRRVKRVSPGAIIAVTGCYAQTDTEAVKQLEDVDIIAGTNEKSRLVEMALERIADSEAGRSRERDIAVRAYEGIDDFEELGVITGISGRSRGYIKIEEGCDRFCSYCIIPYARGRVRSREPEIILEEAAGLIDRGIREIVLAGINTALYGKDLKGGIDIIGIIKEISSANRDKSFRIRLSSLEPNVIDADMAGRLCGLDRLCRHMHLSLQSGCDSVLERMNRRYNMEQYRKIINVLKSSDSLYGITTDIIAGFPGETDAEFEETLNSIEKIGFSRIHSFRYSRRPGTKAAEMKDQVDEAVKNTRMERLAELSAREEKKFYKRNEGSIAEVLVEEVLKGGENVETTLMRGYSGNYIRVYIDCSSSDFLNKFVKVKLIGTYRDGMKGELLY